MCLHAFIEYADLELLLVIADRSSAPLRSLHQYRRHVVTPCTITTCKYVGITMLDVAIIVWNILEAHAHHMHGMQLG